MGSKGLHNPLMAFTSHFRGFRYKRFLQASFQIRGQSCQAAIMGHAAHVSPPRPEEVNLVLLLTLGPCNSNKPTCQCQLGLTCAFRASKNKWPLGENIRFTHIPLTPKSGPNFYAGVSLKIHSFIYSSINSMNHWCRLRMRTNHSIQLGFLTCTFRASCYSTRLSWAHTPTSSQLGFNVHIQSKLL